MALCPTTINIALQGSIRDVDTRGCVGRCGFWCPSWACWRTSARPRSVAPTTPSTSTTSPRSWPCSCSGWCSCVRRPTPTLPWVLIGVALAGWTIGDLVFTVIGGNPTASAADAFYLVGYVGFIVATALFLRARTPERDLDRGSTRTLIGIAAFLFLWIGIIGPAWSDTGVSTAGRLMTALYPLLDVVLLFFLVRLLLAPGRVCIANRGLRDRDRRDPRRRRRVRLAPADQLLHGRAVERLRHPVAGRLLPVADRGAAATS